MKLYVFLNNELEGELTQDENGGFSFKYNEKAVIPLSLSLPLREEAYTHKECRGYFNGLLPESDDARRRIAEKYNIKNPNNDFAILAAIGYDCPGAVSFKDTPAEDELKEFYEIKGRELSEEELEKYIKELPVKPLGTGAGLRLSLAGAQCKTSVLLQNNKIMLPENMTPAAHILKPAVKNLKETVENEYLCLKTAEKLGIKTPKSQILTAGKTKFFLIERYDRIIQDNKIKRLHQEDFCQAVNIISAFKYETDGGVSFKNCIDVLNKTSEPASNIKEFLKRMIFNYLILNNDAHGKNFSIIRSADGRIIFAPAYDLLCTRVYKNLDYKMSMAIGGFYDCEGIKPVHFEKLAENIGISFALMKKMIIDMCGVLPDVLEQEAAAFENSIGKQILSAARKQCRRNLENFKMNL